MQLLEAQFERRPCRIDTVGKLRNGRIKYWCAAHHAPAWNTDGSVRTECKRSDRLFATGRSTLTLDAADFDGGLAAWGCLASVYNTTSLCPEQGIHVHARARQNAHKVIDGTFPAVRLSYGGQSHLIDAEAAISFTVSNVFGVPSEVVRCPRCGNEHIDADVFAVNPHRKHLCNACGRDFLMQRSSVGNPLAALQDSGKEAWRRPTVDSTRRIDIDQTEWAGGIQIWGTNPAILWTASRPEEAGIHVHCYDQQGREYGQEAVDETFGEVLVDGIRLDPQAVRLLMIQNHMPSLANRIASLVCPHCQQPHLGTGEFAYSPTETHSCRFCSRQFPTPGRRRKVVSNPAFSQFLELRKSVAS